MYLRMTFTPQRCKYINCWNSTINQSFNFHTADIETQVLARRNSVLETYFSISLHNAKELFPACALLKGLVFKILKKVLFETMECVGGGVRPTLLKSQQAKVKNN